MKLFKYIKTSIWVAPLLSLFACSDFDDYTSSVSEMDDNSYTVSMSVPSYTITSLSTRAGNDWIDNLSVIYYKNDNQSDASNSFIEQRTISDFTTSENNIVISIPKVQDAKYIQIIINKSLGVNEKDASQVFVSDHYLGSDPNKAILWGMAQLPESSNSFQMQLLHHDVKVSIAKGEGVTNFSLEKFGVFGSTTTGSLAPKDWNFSSEEPNLPSSPVYGSLTDKTDSELIMSGNDFYVFETPEGKAKIIIKGSYNGANSTYYVAEFNERKASASGSYSEDPDHYTYKDIPLIRGHNYRLVIDEVRSEGWPTLSEALLAKPDNRMTILVIDETESITNIVSCKDYALGVNKPDPIPAVATTGKPMETYLYVASSYPVFTLTEINSNKINFNVSGTTSSNNLTWNLEEVETVGSTDKIVDSDINSGTLYKLKISTQEANKTQEEKQFEIIVSAGDLERRVTITQSAYDPYRSGDRAVQFKGTNISLGSTDWQDYIAWLDQCKGVSAEANRNVARNEGLHFPPVPSYTLQYRIPKLAGDNTPTISAGFTCSDGGDYYIISATADQNLVIGNFSFKNANNETLQYKLYKTGIFHNLTQSVLNSYARPEETVEPGWYYYELVNANGILIMDRNLGATTNAPYKSTNSTIRKNTGAKGAYFKIAENPMPKQSQSRLQEVVSTVTIQDKLLLPSGFNIPLQKQIEGLGIYTSNQGGSNGTAVVATVNVTGQVADSKIFFPHCGYYDASSKGFKNDENANVWTKNLHCYSQGFDSHLSKEFGFWYRYLNGYGTTLGATQIKNIGQLRYVDGSEGGSNGCFRYMPIRLVYGTSASTPRTGSDYYLRGSWNSFGNGTEAYRFYVDSSTQWSTNTITLYKGQTFKVANQNTWDGFNYGKGDDTVWEAGKKGKLSYNSGNLEMNKDFTGVVILTKSGNDYYLELKSN